MVKPDWGKVPDRFIWWAIDADGRACFFTAKPAINEVYSIWYRTFASKTFDQMVRSEDWKTSLQQRPAI